MEKEKKQRNAVIEVLRFHCQQVYPVNLNQGSGDSQIYAVALELLKNGDIKGSVKHLNKHKKSRLAMIISRSVNSRFAMDQFDVYIKQVVG